MTDSAEMVGALATAAGLTGYEPTGPAEATNASTGG